MKRRFPVVGPECALLGSGRTEKDEKTEVKERHGSMRVPLSLVTTLATLKFGRQGMPIRGERVLRNGRSGFSGFTANVGRKTWERCMTSCGMTGMWRSSRRTRHTLSIRLLTGTCSQGPPRYAGFEQQRKCPRRGGEALPGVSLPPWKGSASRKNHEERTSTADSC